MMDRRQVLSRLPLVSMAVAGVSSETLAGPEPTELMRLFRQWDALDHEAWHVESDDRSNALCDQMRQIEMAMIGIPATTAAEFAAKVIALTSYGDWMPSREFIAESARVCGASRASELALATSERDL